MIELGLTRVARLLRNTPQPWKALHVAGTNGKGSVCAYASAMLHESGVRCGRFTSPHLIDRWDCITIGEATVSPDLFHNTEAVIKADNANENIGATEFEILTATAFEIFRKLKLEVGVVEVGLGGTDDATNIIQHPTVTVITMIGQDHESYLGDSIEAIASHKGGIMKANALCLVDGNNAPSVLEVLRKCAVDHRASSFSLVPQDASALETEIRCSLSHREYAPHQLVNIQLAFQAVQAILRILGRNVPQHRILAAIESTSWPGRLQLIDLGNIVRPHREVLLDGAHNSQAAEMLGSFVDNKLRKDDARVIWIVGTSRGKDIRGILGKLLRPKDSIIAVPFQPVEGMPWVEAMDPAAIAETALSVCPLNEVHHRTESLETALHMAADFAEQSPIVIAGSLYLVSEILRLKK